MPRIVVCNLVGSAVSVPTMDRNEAATDRKPMNEMSAWPTRLFHPPPLSTRPPISVLVLHVYPDDGGAQSCSHRQRWCHPRLLLSTNHFEFGGWGGGLRPFHIIDVKKTILRSAMSHGTPIALRLGWKGRRRERARTTSSDWGHPWLATTSGGPPTRVTFPKAKGRRSTA